MDTLTNKLPELASKIKNAKTPPSIIAIAETKPKNYRYPLTTAELKLDDYDISTKNITERKGWGLTIYMTSELKANGISLQTAFDEHLSICVKLENDEKVAITCIYRSSSSATDNNNNLCKLIKEIDSRPEHLKVILGDFNYPSITWNNLHDDTTDNNESRDPHNFKETIIESYLNQLVDFPTRARGTDNPSCIDWVFTNNETLINGITVGSSLGSSDHTLIEVDINTTPKDNSTHYKFFIMTKETTQACGNMVQWQW